MIRDIHSSLGGGTRVTVSKPKWPVLCACCLARAETTVKIEFDETDDVGTINYLATWQVPYCKPCANHVHEEENLRKRSISFSSFAAGALSALMLSWVLCLYFKSKLPLFLVMAGSLVLLGILNGRRLMASKKLTGPKCTHVGPAVWCARLKRSDKGDWHTFAFNNAEYAKAFESVNKQPDRP